MICAFYGGMIHQDIYVGHGSRFGYPLGTRLWLWAWFNVYSTQLGYQWHRVDDRWREYIVGSSSPPSWGYIARQLYRGIYSRASISVYGGATRWVNPTPGLADAIRRTSDGMNWCYWA